MLLIVVNLYRIFTTIFLLNFITAELYIHNVSFFFFTFYVVTCFLKYSASLSNYFGPKTTIEQSFYLAKRRAETTCTAGLKNTLHFSPVRVRSGKLVPKYAVRVWLLTVSATVCSQTLPNHLLTMSYFHFNDIVTWQSIGKVHIVVPSYFLQHMFLRMSMRRNNMWWLHQ